MNNYVEEMQIVHSTPFVPRLEQERRRRNFLHRGPFSEAIEYKNSLNIPLTIVERNGFRHSVPSLRISNEQEAFVVRHIYNFVNGYADDVDAWGRNLPVDATLHQKKLYAEYTRLRNERTANSDIQVTLDYEIITPKQGNVFTLYNSDEDIVITTRSIREAPAHPSQANRFPGDDGTNSVKPYVTDTATTVRVEIVDNNYNSARKFIFITGECLDVLPVRDSTRPDGVYITSTRIDIGNPENRPSRVTKQLTMAEAEEQYGLCSDRESARFGGDIKLSTKRQVETLERENILLKQTLTNEKHELDRQRLAMEKENTSATREFELLKNELRQSEHARQLVIAEMENDRKKAELKLARLETETEMEKLLIKDKYERAKFIRTEISEESKLYRSEISDKSKYQGDLIKFLSTAIISMVAVVGPLTKLWLMLKSEKTA